MCKIQEEGYRFKFERIEIVIVQYLFGKKALRGGANKIFSIGRYNNIVIQYYCHCLIAITHDNNSQDALFFYFTYSQQLGSIYILAEY